MTKQLYTNRITRWLNPLRRYAPQQVTRIADANLNDWDEWWKPRPAKDYTITNREWLQRERVRLMDKRVRTRIVSDSKKRIALFRGE